MFTHISARVPGPEHHFLINPYGMMFEEITASSLVKVDLAGAKVMDSPFEINPAGFTIHSAVHEARPEAGCVLHTHTRAGVAVSAQQCGVLIASEMGRFPIVNGLAGKDHLPEHPAILLGPGLRPGTYGETDARMLGCPVSLVTGRPSSSATDVQPTVDDLGATLLHWYGVQDTRSRGYLGRRLDFLIGKYFPRAAGVPRAPHRPGRKEGRRGRRG